MAETIHRQLTWHPAPRFIEVDRFEELGPCYQALRRKIPDILAETHVDPASVLVDYTGGTKTMSAALALAAVEWFNRFSYVGGEQRERAGLGVVVEGRERILYQGNPWTELAIREVERASGLWKACLFDAAAETLRGVANKVASEQMFTAIADLADGLAARHRLDFHEAVRRLQPLRSSLPLLFDGRPDAAAPALARAALETCRACTGDQSAPEFVRELLDNALRTARQGRYEDAAARLYRAMEMQGQVWLQDATVGAFVNGRFRSKGACLPPALAQAPYCRPDTDGEIKLSLESVFRALDALGDARAERVVEDLDQGRAGSRWRTATELRNAGILAHGVRAVGVEGFERMKAVAAEFLGFELEREANPIPPLRPEWFLP